MSITGNPEAEASRVKPLRSRVTLGAAIVMIGPRPPLTMSRVTM